MCRLYKGKKDSRDNKDNKDRRTEMGPIFWLLDFLGRCGLAPAYSTAAELNYAHSSVRWLDSPEGPTQRPKDGKDHHGTGAGAKLEPVGTADAVMENRRKWLELEAYDRYVARLVRKDQRRKKKNCGRTRTDTDNL
jgi:hypothetical protein